MRILLLAALALVIIAWLMRPKKSLPPASSPPDEPRAAMREGESMVACAYCGIHVPVSESVIGPQGVPFCSEEHRRLHG